MISTYCYSLSCVVVMTRLSVIAPALLVAGEHFAIAHGQPRADARVVVHADVPGLAVQCISDVIADRLGGRALVGDRVADVAGFHPGRILFLMVLLDLVASECTRCRTTDCREGLALAASNLVARKRADQPANHGAANLVLVLVGFRNRDLLIAAHLPRFACSGRL